GKVWRESLWDLDALAKDPEMYDVGRKLLGLHWLDELEATYFEIALLDAQSAGGTEARMAFVRALRQRLPEFRPEIENLAATFVAGQAPRTFLAAGMTTAVLDPSLTSLFVALRKKDDPAFNLEVYRQHARDLPYVNRLFDWCIQNIYEPTR